MNRAILLFYGFTLAVFFSLYTPALSADAEIDATRGPGTYQDSVLNLDANITKEVNFGLGFEQATSSNSASLDPVKIYTGTLTVKSPEHYTFGLSGTDSPEQNDAKSAGWGVSAAYDSAEGQNWGGLDKGTAEDTAAGLAGENDKEPGNFTWGCSLSYDMDVMSELIDYNTYQKRLTKRGKVVYTAVNHSDWYSLKQSHVDPGVSFSLFQAVDLELGYSKYSYDRDVAVFSQRLAKLSALKIEKSANFGNTTALIDGFPDRISSAGIAVNPWDCLKVEFDWSRTIYVLAQPEEDSSTLNVYYNILSFLQVKAGYNVLSTGAVYTTAGIKWLW